MRRFLQILLPVLVLAIAFAAVQWMFANVEKPKVVPPPPNVPIVRTVVAQPAPVQLDVESQGTVEARTAIPLAAQVSGRVVEMSPSLRAGRFFEPKEVLLQIDRSDYELAVAQQQAEVARAELKLAQERAEAASAERAWRQLEGDRPIDPLTARVLQVTEAESALAAAKASLQRARLDLERTAVSLPFAGRVRTTNVDVGMLVTAGSPFAEVYGIDYAEVRLPIPDEEARFLALSLDGLHGGDEGTGGHGSNGGGSGPTVELTADFAGRKHTWTGVIDRIAGEIDRKTRQLTLVARVEDPYARNQDGRPPLAVGMFVQATIAGRRFADVVALPRQALRTDGTMLVVDDERMLRQRKVEVLRQDRRTVYVRGGIEAGDRVCISPLETFVEGMPVRLLQEQEDVPTDGTPAGAGQEPVRRAKEDQK